MARRNSLGSFADDSEHDTCVAVQLSEPQERVLVELTLGRSISAAATAAGVHRTTVHRWMREDPLFAAAYHGWQSETRSSAQARFLAMSDLAVDNICDALRKGDTRTSLVVVKAMGLLTDVKPGITDVALPLAGIGSFAITGVDKAIDVVAKFLDDFGRGGGERLIIHGGSPLLMWPNMRGQLWREGEGKQVLRGGRTGGWGPQARRGVMPALRLHSHTSPGRDH